MNFDHRHYVPILKGKGGEFWALQNLKPSAKELITPVIELCPHNPKSHTFETDLGKKIVSLAACWPQMPLYFDVRYVAPRNGLPEPSIVTAAFRQLRARGIRALPVTKLGYSQDFQKAIKGIIAADRAGLMVRLTVADLAVRDKLATALSNLCDFVSVPQSEVDLLIDYGFKNPDEYEDLVYLQELHLGKIPNVAEWRTLTLASASFPESIKDLPDRQWVSLDRTEWKSWDRLISSSTTVRKPSYGDYGTRHPSLPGFGTPKPNLRYTLKDSYLCRRDDAKHVAMKEICRSLVKRSEYMGSTFSVGDLAISTTAASPGSRDTGGPTQWTQWGSNHHLEFVATQIQSLPSS